MPLSSLLKSAAGILSREHPDCRRTYQAGWNEMVSLVEEARLREFRDRLALDDGAADQKATTLLDRATTDRLTLDARLAAIAKYDPGHPHERDLRIPPAVWPEPGPADGTPSTGRESTVEGTL